MTWKAKIPKTQKLGWLPGASFAWSECNGDFYIVYNDKSENYPLDEVDGTDCYLAHWARKNVVGVSTITSSGEVTREILINSEENILNFLPRFSQGYDDCTMFICSGFGKKYQFGKIEMVK